MPGVSRATASLIVRNSPRTSEATRKKVLASMHELGYVYNRVAANMRSNHSATVGVIIPDIENTFFSELLIGIHQKLEEHGYTIFLGTSFDSDSKQVKLLSTMQEHRVDGIILCPASGSSQETIDKINKMDIPIVHAVRELQEVNCHYVGVDNKIGAQLAVNHLIQNGHRKIAFLGGRSSSPTWIERKQAYDSALHQAGIEPDESLVIEGPPTRQGGRDTVKQLLSQHNLPTAIFGFNDLVASGIIQELKEAGVIPGQDIALVGFDNVPESELLIPSLTTVSAFAQILGNHAAELLEECIESESGQQHLILKPELIIRNSSQGGIKSAIGI